MKLGMMKRVKKEGKVMEKGKDTERKEEWKRRKGKKGKSNGEKG